MTNETWQKSYLIFNQHAELASLVFESQIIRGQDLKRSLICHYVAVDHMLYIHIYDMSFKDDDGV